MTKATGRNSANWLQSVTNRVTKLHFVFIAAYIAQVIVFDSWNLITHEAVAERWTLAGILLVLTIVIWYISRINFSSNNIYMSLMLLLIVADIAFIGTNVYWERGVASKSVALFAIPLVTAAALRSRSTLAATAALSAAVYSTVAVRYFNEYYGESLRVQLYGEIGFFCAMFFVIAALLWVVVQPRDS